MSKTHLEKIQYEKRGLDNFLFLENCEHEFCIEGYCNSCGIEMGVKIDFNSGYGDTHVKSKSASNQGYDHELSQLTEISEELREVVSSKFRQKKGRVRDSSRANDVFCETYIGGAKMGELKPDSIAKSLGMNGKGVNKSLRAISGTSLRTIKDDNGKVILMPVVSINPLDCVVDICEQIDRASKDESKEKLANHIEDIKKIIAYIIRKCPSLLNERPRHVAAGFIKYYCQINSLPFQEMGIQLNLSNPTLNQYNSKAKLLCEKYTKWRNKD
jgi:hypothetical protein